MSIVENISSGLLVYSKLDFECECVDQAVN